MAYYDDDDMLAAYYDAAIAAAEHAELVALPLDPIDIPDWLATPADAQPDLIALADLAWAEHQEMF